MDSNAGLSRRLSKCVSCCSHGNNCAGLIAASKDNDKCGCGIAYRADIVGMYCMVRIK